MKKLMFCLMVLVMCSAMASADFINGMIARYDFESGTGADSSGNGNNLMAVGTPTIVSGVGGEMNNHKFMLVDTAAGKFQGVFSDGSAMDPGGLNAINGSFTIWLSVTGPQHRWTNQTQYLTIGAGPDQYGRGPSQIKIYDQTYGGSTADGFTFPEWSSNYEKTVNHGGDYYSWPDVHQIALIWDQATQTAYVWDSLSGSLQSFGNNSGLLLYGDVTWTLGAKNGDKSVPTWQAYIDEVRFYNQALSAGELSQITAVPEPATISLLVFGALAFIRKR
jgi:hypothetical protein